ncbi:NADH:ubiquinone oxidoreductase 14kD subunit [Metarhizium rileyi]|uniref:NADH dehydrogenase [ubiquinone] 1 alpha subcomplex subunit 13 n=1 Tax=Metarhizium rileyi (strain RCEF 4871) TaxID=1649241 RepID=A0A166Y1Z6_METRR|nr:NADH:ubiquinone oxidoreductase 14kD subunit [Metarhizium rileyi RCEF 4871]
MAQDMPPRGGYEPVQYKRNLPAKGFRPGILLLGVGAVMGFGWYKLIGGIREAKYVSHTIGEGRIPITDSACGLDFRMTAIRGVDRAADGMFCNEKVVVLTGNSELAREKMWARINLIPLLQAEEDRDQVRRYWADQKREKELLGDNAKVYNNESRFVRPTFAISPVASK